MPLLITGHHSSSTRDHKNRRSSGAGILQVCSSKIIQQQFGKVSEAAERNLCACRMVLGCIRINVPFLLGTAFLRAAPSCLYSATNCCFARCSSTRRYSLL